MLDALLYSVRDGIHTAAPDLRAARPARASNCEVVNMDCPYEEVVTDKAEYRINQASSSHTKALVTFAAVEWEIATQHASEDSYEETQEIEVVCYCSADKIKPDVVIE